jgi:hypothetical protein
MAGQSANGCQPSTLTKQERIPCNGRLDTDKKTNSLRVGFIVDRARIELATHGFSGLPQSENPLKLVCFVHFQTTILNQLLVALLAVYRWL